MYFYFFVSARCESFEGLSENAVMEGRKKKKNQINFGWAIVIRRKFRM